MQAFFGLDPQPGLSLYTLRKEMKAHPQRTLREVKNAGYTFMEDAGYENGMFYGMKPLKFKALLDELDLVPLSSHQAHFNNENANKILTDMQVVGFSYLVIPFPPEGSFTLDSVSKVPKISVEKLTETLNSWGERCRNEGIALLYHNHDFEFKKDEKGFTPMQYLLENTNPHFVNIELDVYWAVHSGAGLLPYFKEYPKRFPLWHLKDRDDQGRFAPVGQGNIDFAALLKRKELAGMKFALVEQDETYDGMTAFEAIKLSREKLKKFGFR